MYRIFIATSSFNEQNLINLQNSNNYEFEYNPYSRKLNEDELIDCAINSDAIIAGTENYSKYVLSKLKNLKIISRLGIGMDNIDLDEAKRKGVEIFRTQTTPAPAVSELVLGLIIDVSRRISHQNSLLKSGIWEKTRGNLIQQKTLGIIGLGNIGKNLVSLTRGFNLKILAFDNHQDENFAKNSNVKYCDLDTLLSSSDIVSIHLNLSDETRNLLSKKNLKKLKKNSILINTSRGEIIDEEALYKMLLKEEILGAGLDVFNQEPYKGPLLELNNVVVTPHIGAYAKEIRLKMESEALINITNGFDYEK